MKKGLKKLHLSRETVGRLNGSALRQAKGGDEWTGCLSDCTECGGRTGESVLGDAFVG
jgi:hypothetical protein